MSIYPDRPATEERIGHIIERANPPVPGEKRPPQVASMCELIANRLQEQEKLLQRLREKLAPVTSPVPKSEDESANKVENAMVPLAEGLRDTAKKIAVHNHWIDMMISAVEL